MQEITINLIPSKQFLALVLAVFLINLGVIFILPTLLSIKILLIVLLTCYVLYIIWRYVLLKHPRSVTKLMFDSPNWYLENQSGLFPIQFSGESTVTLWLCVLRFKIPGDRLKSSCVIFKDMMDADVYRKFLVLIQQ